MKTSFKFELGDKVKCIITGFSGKIICRSEWFSGCLQYCVKPPMVKDGEMLDGQHIDENQLTLIAREGVPVDGPNGGPQSDEPPR